MPEYVRVKRESDGAEFTVSAETAEHTEGLKPIKDAEAIGTDGLPLPATTPDPSSAKASGTPPKEK